MFNVSLSEFLVVLGVGLLLMKKKDMVYVIDKFSGVFSKYIKSDVIEKK